MFSATRRCGAPQAFTDWQQLNVPGAAIAVNVPPGKRVSPVLRAFVDYVPSPRGQASAVRRGYVAW